MKIFAIGDTLWNFERFRPEYFPEGQELTKEDVVLQLGDFGGVWFGDERDDEALDWLKGLLFKQRREPKYACAGEGALIELAKARPA